MLSWGVIVALAIGVYLQRAAGALLLRADRLADWARKILDALPLAIIGGVVALTAATSNGQVSFDARVVGVAVAAICAQRKLPMLVSVTAAAVVTALVRSAGWG